MLIGGFADNCFLLTGLFGSLFVVPKVTVMKSIFSTPTDFFAIFGQSCNKSDYTFLTQCGVCVYYDYHLIVFVLVCYE